MLNGNLYSVYCTRFRMSFVLDNGHGSTWFCLVHFIQRSFCGKFSNTSLSIQVGYSVSVFTVCKYIVSIRYVA